MPPKSRRTTKKTPAKRTRSAAGGRGTVAATKRKPAPSRPPSPATRVDRFFSRHLRHLSGRWAGQPFELEPWERNEIITPIFNTLDRHGNRRYREALIGVSRGNGKSPVGAGIALYGLFADGEIGAEVYSLAGSKEQARRVFDTAKRMVLASPMLSAAAKVYRDAIEVPESGSVYRVLAADAKLAHGYDPHIVVVDELHVQPKPDLYEAMQSALHKRTQPLLLSFTTAGYDRDTIAYRLFEYGMRDDDPRFFFRWWQAPDGCRLNDTKAWRKANPASWVTIDLLRSQLRRMPEPVFRRLHLNQWTTTADVWIDQASWDACDGDPDIPADETVYIGVDAAPKRDTTAVVVVWRDDDGDHHWITKIFRADRAMGYLDYEEVEDYIRDVAHQWNVGRILVDPYTMTRSMLMLAGEGLPVEEFPQNDARMVPVSQTLYDLVLEQRLRHGGHRELAIQCANAAARETSRGWRLHKLRSAGPIDALVAGGMASHILEQDEGGDPMVWAFDDEDLADDDAEA